MLFTASLVPTAAPAAIVTWSTPARVTDDIDGRAADTLLGAFNLGAADVTATTINGVVFLPLAMPDNDPCATFSQSNFSLRLDASRASDTQVRIDHYAQ